jgi:hypothetical protein
VQTNAVDGAVLPVGVVVAATLIAVAWLIPQVSSRLAAPVAGMEST